MAQERPDYLLSDYNIYTYDIFLVETSGAAGVAAYDAGLKVHAGYGQVEAELADGLKVTGGVRFESGKMSVEPIDLFGTGAESINRTRINKEY